MTPLSRPGSAQKSAMHLSSSSPMTCIISHWGPVHCGLGNRLGNREVSGLRISTSKYEAMVLSQKRVDCPLWVGETFPPQVEELKYIGPWKMEWEVDGLIVAVPAMV